MTAEAVCLFFFIAELVLNTWAKTSIVSWYPFKMIGYTGSFFWCLDIIAIFSMFPDIDWIAEPMGLGGITSSVSGNSNLTKAGRVVR